MSRPDFNELTASVRVNGQAMLTAAQMGLDAPVAAHSEWTVGDLLLHVGRMHRVSTLVLTTDVDSPPKVTIPADADPIAYADEALDGLVHALEETKADQPCWNWTGKNLTAGFWATRAALETAVHRYDIQQAYRIQQPIDMDLAMLGIEEFGEVQLVRFYAKNKHLEGFDGKIALIKSDDRETWLFEFHPDSYEYSYCGTKPVVADATISAHASRLYLWLWNRFPATVLDCSGDLSLLQRYTDTVKITGTN